MKIKSLIWLDEIVEKLIRKHNVDPKEVVELLSSQPSFRYVEKGRQRGEDVYAASGQTRGGRYLIIFFVYKKNGSAIILSAREMTLAERKKYEKK